MNLERQISQKKLKKEECYKEKNVFLKKIADNDLLLSRYKNAISNFESIKKNIEDDIKEYCIDNLKTKSDLSQMVLFFHLFWYYI